MEEENFNAARQWESILGIDIEYEILIYRYLSIGLRKKELKKLKDCDKFTTYNSWKNHILHVTEGLEKNQLNEFIRFLNTKVRSTKIYDSLFNSLLIPFIVLLFSVFVINNEIINLINFNNIFDADLEVVSEVVKIAIKIAVISWAVYFLFKTSIREYQNTMYEKYFFVDILEIINDKESSDSLA